MEALGGLMRDPQVADEQMAGLDIAERVWATTKQLLGDYPAVQKLA